MKKRPLPVGTKLHSEHSEKVFGGVRWDIYQWQQKMFDGSTETFELAKRDDTVIIIPLIDEDHILAVSERQPHWDKDGLVLVAGMVHKEEDIELAARRELEEETGYIFKDFYLVDVDYPTPGVEWGTYTYIATNLVGQKEKSLDAGEQNSIVILSMDELIKNVRSQSFLFKPVYIENFFIRDNVDELFKVFKNPEDYQVE
jgi:ADP-ribose pyrophosphatase